VSACSSEKQDTTRAEVTVFLDTGVTAEQRGAVEQRMRSMPGVDEVTFESRDQAYEHFKEQFKDQPDVVAGVRPESLPESLRVTVADASIAEAVELVAGSVDGVRDTVLAAAKADPTPERIGVILRLTGTPSDAVRAAVQKAVDAIPQAESVVFEDSAAAYKRLRERCEGKGDLAGALDPQRTSASVRFRLRVAGTVPGLIDLEKLDGVADMLLVPVAVL
jgi:cell division protein FtsX